MDTKGRRSFIIIFFFFLECLPESFSGRLEACTGTGILQNAARNVIGLIWSCALHLHHPSLLPGQPLPGLNWPTSLLMLWELKQVILGFFFQCVQSQIVVWYRQKKKKKKKNPMLLNLGDAFGAFLNLDLEFKNFSKMNSSPMIRSDREGTVSQSLAWQNQEPAETWKEHESGSHLTSGVTSKRCSSDTKH